MYLNKAMIYGNLTRDPELKALPSGMNVCSFSLATNRVYNDRDGNRQEAADYHNIVVFGKQADNCAKYLTKGSATYVEGRLQTRSWDKDGAKQYRTEVVADRVQFGPKNSGGGEGGASAPTSGSQSSGAPAPVKDADAGKAPAMPDYPEEEINPEDIPF
ncbi:MAG: single-strand DNA-binding protein [Candidatus Paceibacteria bacterium]|jgi:single-strand DNA-binding protein